MNDFHSSGSATNLRAVSLGLTYHPNCDLSALPKLFVSLSEYSASLYLKKQQHLNLKNLIYHITSCAFKSVILYSLNKYNLTILCSGISHLAYIPKTFYGS